VTDSRSTTTQGDEEHWRYFFSGFEGSGSVTIDPNEYPGFGSGCPSGSGSGPPPEPPVGVRTGDFDQTWGNLETYDHFESWSGSASHGESSGYGVITAEVSDQSTFDVSEDHHEWGSYSNPYQGAGAAEEFSSSSSFAGKSAQHQHSETFASSHTRDGEGTGNGSGTAFGSSSGGSGNSTLNHTWDDWLTESQTHTFSHGGSEAFGVFSPTPVNTGSYSETYSRTNHSTYDDQGSVTEPFSAHSWNKDQSHRAWSWFNDTGNYDFGTSQGTETADQFDAGLFVIYHVYTPGGPSMEGSPFETTNMHSSVETCNYPPDEGEEPCHAVGGAEPISWETILDWTQTALDIIGFIPGPIGMIADILNTGISLARGDYAGAALNAIGIIPGLGDAAKAAKMGANALQGAAKLADAAKTAGKLADAGKGAGKSGLGLGRAGSNLAGGADDVAGASRGANRGAEAASTTRKADDASPCGGGGNACQVGEGCFVGETPVVLRLVNPESQAVAAGTTRASDEAASDQVLAMGAALVGVAGLGLALVGDLRRRQSNRLVAVDSLFGQEQSDDWFGPARGAPDDAMGTSAEFEKLCDDLFAASSPSEFSEDDEMEQLSPFKSPRPPDDGFARSESTDETDAASEETCSTAVLAPAPVNRLARLRSTVLVPTSLAPCQARRTGAGSLLRWSGIGLAVLGFAVWGWLSVGGPSRSPTIAATQIAHAPPQVEYLTKPIRDIEVIHDRVLADNPEIDGDAASDFGPIEPLQWRILRLTMTKRDGGRLDITLARPTAWIERHAASPGNVIYLDLPEVGAQGEARVTDLTVCPALPPGSGRLVTGKFVHESAEVLDLSVDGLPDPIGTTANHPFWSEDRHEFVAAGDLRTGEALRCADGTRTRVTHIAPRDGPQTVYNLEIDGEHAYCVTDRAIICHNEYVYRVIRPDEDIANGIVAKRPGFEYPKKVNTHVLHGSKKWFKGDKWISTTKSPDVAAKWAKESGGRVVKIDLSKTQDTITDTIDLTKQAMRDKHLSGVSANNFAKASEEVLIEGTIHPRAITDVTDELLK
jgi:hypothetical protein